MGIKLFLIAVFILLFTGMYGQAKENAKEQKVLVVYFSYTGNTRELAKQVQKHTGGDLVEIEPETPYSKDYKTVEKQGQEEVNSGYKPPLKTKIKNIEIYDVIIIGSPIWWFTIAPPVSTFLSQYNLSGKKIALFVTHGGYGPGHSLEDVRKLASKAILLKAYDVEGERVNTTKDKTIQWLKDLKL